MAWDDAPPDTDIAKSGNWDAAPPDDDIANPPQWSDLPGNILPDAKQIGQGALQTGMRVLNGISDLPSDAEETVKDEFTGKNPLDSPIAQDVKTIGSGVAKAVTDIPHQLKNLVSKDSWIQHPVQNAVNAAAIVAPFIGGGEVAAEDLATGAAKGAPAAAAEHAASAIPAERVIGNTVAKAQPAAAEPLQVIPAALKSAPSVPPAAAPAKSTIGQRMAARTTSQALDISPLAARKLAAKAGVSPDEAILQLGNQAHDLIPNLVEPLDSANSKFTKILNAHDAAGKEIGAIVDNATKGTKEAFPEANETIAALRSAAQDYYQVDGGDLAIQKTADRLDALQKAGKLDFDRLSQVKSAIGKGFNKTDVPAGTDEIYGILNDGLDKVINRLSVQDPTLGDNFSHLKQVYSVTSRLLPAMSRTAAREVSGSSLGGGVLSKTIPTALGGAIGGVPGAILGGAAKYLQEAIAPDLGKNLSYMAMKATPEMIAKVQKAFPQLSKAAAASIAARVGQNNSGSGMAKGGIVPHDVKQWIGSR